MDTKPSPTPTAVTNALLLLDGESTGVQREAQVIRDHIAAQSSRIAELEALAGECYPGIAHDFESAKACIAELEGALRDLRAAVLAGRADDAMGVAAGDIVADLLTGGR